MSRFVATVTLTNDSLFHSSFSQGNSERSDLPKDGTVHELTSGVSYPPTHSITYSLTNTLTQSHIHSLTHSLTHVLFLQSMWYRAVARV